MDSNKNEELSTLERAKPNLNGMDGLNNKDIDKLVDFGKKKYPNQVNGFVDSLKDKMKDKLSLGNYL